MILSANRFHVTLIFFVLLHGLTGHAQGPPISLQKQTQKAIQSHQFDAAEDAVIQWLGEAKSRKDSLKIYLYAGHFHYKERGKYNDTAIRHMQLSHQLLDAGIRLDMPEEIHFGQLHQRKAFLLKWDEPDEAIKHAHRAIEVFGQLNDKQKKAATTKVLADIYESQGEYDRALTYFKKVAQYYVHSIQQKYDPRLAAIASERLTNLCITYRSMGKPQLAVLYGDSAVHIASLLPPDYRPKDFYLARSLIFRSEAQYHLAAYVPGLIHCQTALELLGDTRNGDWQRANRVAGMCAQGLKDDKLAESYFQKALAIQGDSYDSRELSKAYLAYVKFLVDRGKTEKIETYLRKGEELVLDTTKPNQSENLLFRIRAQKGKVYRELYKDQDSSAYLQKSFEAYQQMLDAEKNYLDKLLYESSLLEEVKRSHKRREGLLETAYYLSSTDNDLAAASVDIAWKSSEGRKGVVLWGNLHALNKANKFLPDSALEEMAFLKKAQDPESLAELAQLQEQLLDSFPAYRQAQQGKTPISIQTVQSHLAENQGLIEYFYGRENIFAFFIPPRGKATLHTWKTSTFDSRLKRMIKTLKPGGEPDPALSHDLYQQLLGKLPQPLPENLIIIPDGPLHYLPFEVLLTQAPDTARMKASFWKGQSEKRPNGAAYLLLDHEVQYAHSATLLFAESKLKPIEELAVFAPSYSAKDSFQNRPILPLPGMEIHAQNLMEFIPGRTFAGMDANVNQFLSQAPAFSMLHLALHGFANEEDPLQAALAFSSTDSSAGILTAAQLYGLPPLQAELVSLLSCETGAGQYARGEGVMSLARAFRYAGANSVVMSLWNAEIEPGKFIMERFYTHLQDGETKGAALRSAKLDWLKQAKSHQAYPGSWANFVVVGDAKAIYAPHAGFPFWGFILGGIFFLGVLVFVYRKWKK